MMGDGFQFLDIVLFAMVAAFLVLRLRSVLGKKTGHQEPRQDPISRRQQDPEQDSNVVDLPNRNNDVPEGAADTFEADPTAGLDPNDPLSAGITQIRIADNSFHPAEFADGARGAFEMIVQAFAEGDTATLDNLLAEDVFENFNEAIVTRKEANERLERSSPAKRPKKGLEQRSSASSPQTSSKRKWTAGTRWSPLNSCQNR